MIGVADTSHTVEPDATTCIAYSFRARIDLKVPHVTEARQIVDGLAVVTGTSGSLEDTTKRIVVTRRPVIERRARRALLGALEPTQESVRGIGIEHESPVRKGLANSTRQARQFIAHEHVAVSGRTVTSPSYLVSVEEEPRLAFVPGSALAGVDHPARQQRASKPKVRRPAPSPADRRRGAMRRPFERRPAPKMRAAA